IYRWSIDFAGNICRSPIAEVVMVETLNKAKVQNVVVDSAAIGPWHVGNRADPRAISTLQQHGLQCTHIVRQIRKEDFNEFDYIFGMDEDNMKELNRLKPSKAKAELLLLGDFGLEKKNRIIEDPYYESGAEGFETAYQQCVVACAAFMKERLQK
ncbi:hypothetical protein KR074_002597, partial [Drosophila pseudoananassae]